MLEINTTTPENNWNSLSSKTLGKLSKERFICQLVFMNFVVLFFAACPPELMPSFPRYRNMKRKSSAAALPAPAPAVVSDARS